MKQVIELLGKTVKIRTYREWSFLWRTRKGNRSFIVFEWSKSDCFGWERIIFVVWSARTWGALKALCSKDGVRFSKYTKGASFFDLKDVLLRLLTPHRASSSSSLSSSIKFDKSVRKALFLPIYVNRELVIREKGVFVAYCVSSDALRILWDTWRDHQQKK